MPFDQPGAHRLIYRSGEIQRPRLSEAEPLCEVARDFLAAITERRPPRADASSARPVVAALQAATLSLKENSRRVEIVEILSATVA